MDAYSDLLDNLRDEQNSLQKTLEEVNRADAWDTDTAAPGWKVRDQLYHIARFDAIGALAIRDPDAFVAIRAQFVEAGDDFERQEIDAGAALRPAELVAMRKSASGELLEALASVESDFRIPWFGPSMSARSFATARLMETWAHGYDIAQAVGRTPVPADRIRNIDHLGVITRGWSYQVRGMTAPAGDVRVELVAPSGAVWNWGPEGAASTVTGDATEFALVVTQRLPLDATSLNVTGGSQEWLEIAQCFAGVATRTTRR